MGHSKCDKQSEKNIHVRAISAVKSCIKYLKAKNVNIKSAKINSAKINSADINCSTINCADINTLDTNKIYINGQDITCSLLAPPVGTYQNTFVDIGATGATGPTNVDPVVYDALVENAIKNQKRLQCSIYDGRCAIYQYLKNNGCPDSCPPPPLGPTGGPTGCYIQFTGSIGGTGLTVTGPDNLQDLYPGLVIQGNGVLPNTIILKQSSGNTGGTGTYIVNNTQIIQSESMTAISPITEVCTLKEIPLKIFGAMTLPIYKVINCGPTGATGTNCECIGVTGTTRNSYRSLNTAATFNLQCTYLLEKAKSIDARVVSALVQIGAYDPLTNSVLIEEIFIANKQFYPTLDTLYGENFANTISIPTPILNYALARSKNPNKQGAIQIVVYEEEGICIWDPVGTGFECRQDGSSGNNNAQGSNEEQPEGCFQLVANGPCVNPDDD